MTSPAVKAWTSFLLAAIALYGSFTIWKVYKANNIAAATARREAPAEAAQPLSEVLPPVPLDEFTFIDSAGEPFAMRQLAGKVWVASYFFATCPGFCLQMNQEIAKIVRDLADDDVTFVSFTVDPENDTPDELRQYAQRMQADPRRWVFLTGKQESIQELGQQYLKMPATREHNDKLVLIGRDARVHGFFSSRDPQQVKKLKQKIAECAAAPPAEIRDAEAEKVGLVENPRQSRLSLRERTSLRAAEGDVASTVPRGAAMTATLLAEADIWRILPAADATLNAIAAVLLVVGYALIKQGRELAHQRVMLTAFGVSVAFLACYLTYHIGGRLAGREEVKFIGPPEIRRVYLGILLSHVLLAFTVPVLSIITIWLGLKDRRAAHRRLARWTFPIWLYVSVTGVVIYLMLYHAYAPSAGHRIIVP